MIIKPTILSLLTTNKCTAACRDCCLACSPTNNNRLTLEEMKNYVDQTLSEYDAIKNNDVKRFYEICKQKNLLTFSDNYFANTISKEFILQISQQLGINLNLDTITEEHWSIVFPVMVICAVGVVVYVLVYTDVGVDGGDDDELSRFVKDMSDKEPVLTIWSLKNNSETMPIIADEYLEIIVDSIISIITQEQPDFFDNNDINIVRNIIKLNLLNPIK